MAELTSSTREAARRLGVSDTTMHKAERSGRIVREPNGQWDIAKTRARLLETADPQRSPISGSAVAEGTPFARLKVAQLALKVEAHRLALDESRGRLLDVATANVTIDEIASTMRDALLNWPAQVSGLIAAEFSVQRPSAANHLAAAHRRSADGGR
jgi:DNA-binding XRE family transcriptional regulator